MLNSVVCTF